MFVNRGVGIRGVQVVAATAASWCRCAFVDTRRRHGVVALGLCGYEQEACGDIVDVPVANNKQVQCSTQRVEKLHTTHLNDLIGTISGTDPKQSYLGNRK